MLKRLRRWLGWDDDSGIFVLGSAEPRPKGTSATHGLFVKKPGQGAKPGRQPAPPAPKPLTSATKPAAAARPPPGAGAKLGGEPQLTLDKPPPADNFDPYNTGAFNRSQSWERIGRNRGR